jgi:hypothetical protein
VQIEDGAEIVDEESAAKELVSCSRHFIAMRSPLGSWVCTAAYVRSHCLHLCFSMVCSLVDGLVVIFQESKREEVLQEQEKKRQALALPNEMRQDDQVSKHFC